MIDDLDQTTTQPAIATPSGRIHIDRVAFRAIVRDAVRSRYGVVALGPSRRGRPIVMRLISSFHRHRIGSVSTDGRIADCLSMMVERGTPLPPPARTVIDTVTFQIERMLGIEVDRVDVNVSGRRFSDRTAGTLA
jgi:uncharacterized alkaline shock family protein YloU